MKISELIKILEKLKEKHGDIPVYFEWQELENEIRFEKEGKGYDKYPAHIEIGY